MNWKIVRRILGWLGVPPIIVAIVFGIYVWVVGIDSALNNLKEYLPEGIVEYVENILDGYRDQDADAWRLEAGMATALENFIRHGDPLPQSIDEEIVAGLMAADCYGLRVNQRGTFYYAYYFHSESRNRWWVEVFSLASPSGVQRIVGPEVWEVLPGKRNIYRDINSALTDLEQLHDLNETPSCVAQ